MALIVILLRDGLEVEGEMLQSQWRLSLRKRGSRSEPRRGMRAPTSRRWTRPNYLECRDYDTSRDWLGCHGATCP